MLKLYACLTEQHDPRLMALAGCLCLLASLTAVGLLRSACVAAGRTRLGWAAAAAAAFGGGIWAAHFIAMLGYVPAAGFDHSPLFSAFALARAIVISLFAFALALRGPPAGWTVTVGGILLAVAIGGMHFGAVLALRPAGLVSFEPAAAAAAFAVAGGLGVAALRAVRRRRPAGASALMFAAVAGMHFIALAGTTIAAPHSGNVPASPLPGGLLAVAVAAVTGLVLAMALSGALIDRHLAHRARAEAIRLRRLADATFEGLLFLRDGVVVDANAVLCSLLGRDRDTLLGRPAHALLALPVGLEVLQQGGTAEAEIVDAAGNRRPVELLGRAVGSGRHDETVVAVRDLSDRRRAEQRIEHLANHDSLTGLPNRTLFRDRLAQATALAERTGHGLALLCLDVDGFKAVNDLFGHPSGDAVLIEVSNRLATCLRESDTVARLGGDEFAIVQSFAEQPRGAAALAERVVRLLAEPFEVAGQVISIGASIGIALFPSDARAPDMLLRNADLALYRAKHDGRGVYRFFEHAMDERLQQRRLLEQELRGAMLRHDLRLHYQPLLDSATLTVEGFEALLRWPHPERGFISPAEFVPVAEECGLIIPLGHWVLETACAEAASWPRPWRVAVNLSPAQFRQRDLAESVRTILARTRLAPWRLELEITEGILIDDAERALTMLRELKALGVRIALDDFGTGYSSLSYLRRFPFDKLKIDASFVQGLGDGGEADAIVRAIMALGRSLGLHINAEGVETADQLERLRALECDEVQGFLLGRPAPADQVVALAEPAVVGMAG